MSMSYPKQKSPQKLNSRTIIVFLKSKVVDFNIKLLHFLQVSDFFKEIISSDENSRMRYLQTKFY